MSPPPALTPLRLEKWLEHPSGRRLVELVINPLIGDDGAFRAWGHVGNVVTEWDVLTGKSLHPIGEHPAGVAELIVAYGLSSG